MMPFYKKKFLVNNYFIRRKTKTKKAIQKKKQKNKKQRKYQRQITVRQWTTEPTDTDCVMLMHIRE